MLPAGVLTARRAVVAAARPRWAVLAGIRHRSGDNRKCTTATCRLPEPKRRSYAGCGRRATDFPTAAGYCTARAGKKTVPFVLADIGEGISEVTVKEWYVNVGDVVSEFDDVCEVESDKATVTITSRYAGTVTKVHHETGATARVGSALVDIEVAEEGQTVEEPVAAAAAEPVLADEADRVVAGSTGEPAGLDSSDAGVASKVLTTPAVRRIAAEKGIDLTTVRGTGKQGRVLKEDLLGFEDHLLSSSVPTPSAPAVSDRQPPLTGDFVPLTGYAKTMRKTMEASNKIPTLVITDEVNLTRLIELKAQLAPHVKLTLLPFLVKATSLALARHPRINSTASPDFTAYRPNRSHNIGVAIDTPLGLAVPNVKDVQTLSVVGVARRLAELRAKAANGKLTPSDVTGGTFTLSNMGTIAGSAFQPMILPPEVAIGALGRINYRPRYDDQERLVRTPVMGVSWAADHRILDGAAVARFYKDWKTYVENPSLVLADVQLDESET